MDRICADICGRGSVVVCRRGGYDLVGTLRRIVCAAFVLILAVEFAADSVLPLAGAGKAVAARGEDALVICGVVAIRGAGDDTATIFAAGFAPDEMLRERFPTARVLPLLLRKAASACWRVTASCPDCWANVRCVCTCDGVACTKLVCLSWFNGVAVSAGAATPPAVRLA